MTPDLLPPRMARRVTVDASGCWLWTGWADRNGYGHLRVDGRYTGAHRVAYSSLVGPIADGLQLDHLCRNRLCINPSHLEPVTPRENVLRGDGIAARNARKTHCLRGHEFTPENTELGTQRGLPNRKCRACREIRKQSATS